MLIFICLLVVGWSVVGIVCHVLELSVAVPFMARTAPYDLLLCCVTVALSVLAAHCFLGW